jgi:hypothetical protein
MEQAHKTEPWGPGVVAHTYRQRQEDDSSRPVTVKKKISDTPSQQTSQAWWDTAVIPATQEI